MSFLLLSMLACFGDEITPFPAGLEPLEDCSAGYPSASGSDDTPQGILTNSGQEEDWRWATGCGYLDADVATAWRAIQDEDVVTDRRKASQWERADDGHEPDYDVSFRVWTEVEDILTVDYTIDWRQGVWEGDAEAPESVVARWQKTDGIEIIELLEGSILLDATEDGGSRIQVVEHLEAPGYDPEDLAQYIEDLHASIVAAAAGQALPAYEE